MTIWWLLLILLFIGAVGVAFIWLIVRIGALKGGPGHPHQNAADSYKDAAESDVEHIFNEEFREELRNRGRLHFEKIISDSAMFLQQDLRLTTSELNDYMKNEIASTLKEEFAKYEQSIRDAKQMAIESIQKTNQAIEEQRKALGEQLQNEISSSKELIITRFENNMADIVNHYVLSVLGDQIVLGDQLDYIIASLETTKKDIIEDIKNGA